MDAPSLGTLDWQPARSRPDLLAAPVGRALEVLDVECLAAPIDAGLADTAAFCDAYAVPLEVSANCVVVAGRRGGTTTLAACLVLATDRADVNQVVRRRLDVRKVSFASMDDAVTQTQMEYGGITPVGLPSGWPLLVDRAVADSDWVVVGSGIRGSKLALRGADCARLAGAEVLELRQPRS
jgi:prolyl-tRNA editing enzyme YbaK/EbsC (Cys-tRNA(Pro) deacylase)